MRHLFVFVSVVSLLAPIATGCGSSGAPETEPAWDRRDADAIPPWEEGCESDHVPLVMAHGFLASGDTYANHVKRFEANGYCRDRMFVYDWNTTGTGADPADLDAFIDEVLSATDASAVDLMGHSAGGGLGYTYLENAARASKVRRYVHIGSGEQDGPAGPDGDVPTLNLYSSNDRVVENGGIDGAENVDLVEDDHYEVATSLPSFEAAYEFLNDEPPSVTELTPADGPVILAGRALSLGENAPVAGGRVEIYEVDRGTSARTSDDPIARFTTTPRGYWGPYEARAGASYEFVVRPESGRTVHYYREPFVRNDTLIYLRTIPSGAGLAGILVSALRFDEDQPTSVIFIANRGLQPGDELTVDDLDLGGEAYTDRDNTTIAVFLYDADGDGSTGGAPIPLFGSFPFLAGVDFAPGVSESESTVVTFNGRSLALPRRSAASDGVGIVVFD